MFKTSRFTNDPKNRPNLVMAAVGDQSLHHYWLPNETSTYDLCLIHYGEHEGYAKDAKFHFKRKGAKFNLYAQLLAEVPELSKYQYYWFPDDDIHLNPENIEKLFDFAFAYDLWICQPSLMGWFGLEPTLHHRNCLLRYTNYVEIMCPCFSSEALHKCKSTFIENKSGWGIDSAWNVLLDHPTDKLAVIDDIIAIHTRPVGGGDMYKKQLDSKMENARKEGVAVFNKYNLAAENKKDLKHGFAVSQEIFSAMNYNIVEYGRIFKSCETLIDPSQRIWPKSDHVRKMCKDIRAKQSLASS